MKARRDSVIYAELRGGKTDEFSSTIKPRRKRVPRLLIYDATRGIHRPVKCLDNFEEISTTAPLTIISSCFSV